MAVQRNRQSNGRKNRRRSHHAKVLKALVICDKCKAKRLAHVMCPSCGFYDGRLVVSINAAE
jgi:large subunit ribosomal protein L32